jgi:hypothetical protein
MNATRVQIRDAIRRIKAVLRHDWDPISHGQSDELPADEYEAYAPHVYTLIHRGESDYSIAEHLHELERDIVGGEPRPASSLVAVVEKLREAARTH